MSYKVKQVGSLMAENEIKHLFYQDKFVSWLLSNYRDETQLLYPRELQHYLLLIEGKVLHNDKNLFLIKSILKIFRKQLALNLEEEQKLTIIMLNFVEKAQQEQIKKIPNPHAIAGKVLFWTAGKAAIANTVFRTLLHSDTFIVSNYVENLTLWLASEKQDLSQLLSGEQLELALVQSHPHLTELESEFLVRSLVFNLRCL